MNKEKLMSVYTKAVACNWTHLFKHFKEKCLQAKALKNVEIILTTGHMSVTKCVLCVDLCAHLGV